MRKGTVSETAQIPKRHRITEMHAENRHFGRKPSTAVMRRAGMSAASGTAGSCRVATGLYVHPLGDCQVLPMQIDATINGNIKWKGRWP